jgi:hypothetical protein
MPLLYGERGARAFCRLQQEIMKGSTDHSLFAWRLDPFGGGEAVPALVAVRGWLVLLVSGAMAVVL